MDKKIPMTVAVVFLLMIITMTIRAQISAIETSSEISQETVAHTTRSAATILHVMGSSQNQEFGVVERDEFNDLMYDCGSSSGLAALNGDIKIAKEDSLDSCAESSTYVYDYWEENGLLAGIVVTENGEEEPEWLVVA